MKVVFRRENHFVLLQHTNREKGKLVYTAEDLKSATINTELMSVEINYQAPGKWKTVDNNPNGIGLVAEASLRPGGVILLNYPVNSKKYVIRKNGKYTGRFDLMNKRKEEVMTLLPSINWQRRGHEYTIQLNEEYTTECTTLLILHVVHYTNCLLGMINGGAVPALVDV